MVYIIGGKRVELGGEEEIRYLVSLGCNEQKVRFMQAIENGACKGDLVALSHPGPASGIRRRIARRRWPWRRM